MKCQNLFSGTIKKNISKYCLMKILPRVLSIDKIFNQSPGISCVTNGGTAVGVLVPPMLGTCVGVTVCSVVVCLLGTAL